MRAVVPTPHRFPKPGRPPTDPFAAPAGSDGALEKGVPWPSPRFTDNGNGTVTDNLTGLMWLKNANNAGTQMNWTGALGYCNGLTYATYTDWRLPNRFELESLLDMSQYNPALPSGHPFTSVQSDYYWTSTTHANTTIHAWFVHLREGIVNADGKVFTKYYVWPVRAGQ